MLTTAIFNGIARSRRVAANTTRDIPCQYNFTKVLHFFLTVA
jgi:hypothetical protein